MAADVWPMFEGLLRLLATWRGEAEARAEHSFDREAQPFRVCADELEDALSIAPPSMKDTMKTHGT
jgi:hypothetical protein